MAIDKEKLNEIFNNLDKNLKVAILLHRNPDPDCLGAAAGISLWLKKIYDIDSEFFNYGTISHPQNKTLKNLLHIDLVDGDMLDPTKISTSIILDTDIVGTGLKGKVNDVSLRIDHHSMDRENGVKIKDVRPTGSACSIVWEYLNEFGVSLEEHPDEATALILGIKTDTLDFTTVNTSELDMKAFYSLLPYADKTILSKITKYPLPRVLFETEARAFLNKEIRNTTLVSYAGEISTHNGYIIAAIADRFIRIDGVSTAVIMGTMDDFIIVSVRSDDDRINVDDFCADTFGRSNAGGKSGSGGARFPLGAAYELIEDKETKDRVKEEVIAHMKEKIFSVMGEDKGD